MKQIMIIMHIYFHNMTCCTFVSLKISVLSVISCPRISLF